MNEYDPEKDIGAAVRLLATLLERANTTAQHLDSQTNILIGLSSAIFIFAASRFQIGDQNSIWLPLTFFAAISALISLLAIHPPRFMRKKGQKESLLYNKKIIELSVEEYGTKLGAISTDREALIENYSTEIYNLYKYYYRPKRRLFNLARNVLFAGVIVGLLILIANLFS